MFNARKGTEATWNESQSCCQMSKTTAIQATPQNTSTNVIVECSVAHTFASYQPHWADLFQRATIISMTTKKKPPRHSTHRLGHRWMANGCVPILSLLIRLQEYTARTRFYVTRMVVVRAELRATCSNLINPSTRWTFSKNSRWRSDQALMQRLCVV